MFIQVDLKNGFKGINRRHKRVKKRVPLVEPFVNVLPQTNKKIVFILLCAGYLTRK